MSISIQTGNESQLDFTGSGTPSPLFVQLPSSVVTGDHVIVIGVLYGTLASSGVVACGSSLSFSSTPPTTTPTVLFDGPTAGQSVVSNRTLMIQGWKFPRSDLDVSNSHPFIQFTAPTASMTNWYYTARCFRIRGVSGEPPRLLQNNTGWPNTFSTATPITAALHEERALVGDDIPVTPAGVILNVAANGSGAVAFSNTNGQSIVRRGSYASSRWALTSRMVTTPEVIPSATFSTSGDLQVSVGLSWTGSSPEGTSSSGWRVG